VVNISSHQIHNLICEQVRRFGRTSRISFSSAPFFSLKNALSHSTFHKKQQLTQQIANQVIALSKEETKSPSLQHIASSHTHGIGMVCAYNPFKELRYKVIDKNGHAQIKTFAIENSDEVLAEAYFKLKKLG